MFGLFKLKKKSKKDKNIQNQDEEKENTSSPTKVKKLENDKNKSNNDDVKVEKQQKIDITIISGDGQQNTPSIPRNTKLAKDNNEKALTIETDLDHAHESQTSPLSSATTTLNIHQARCPMLSASDVHTNSFVRGNFLSSTISGSDLHRFLNSGYINGDPYLQRGVEPKTPKSPHFHRPPNFSYTRSRPNYITPRQRHQSAHRVSASSSDTPRFSRNTLNGIVRNRSSSPTSFQQQMAQKANSQHEETVEHINDNGSTTIVTTVTTKRTPAARDLDTEEPIRLAKFPGGHAPDPDEEPRIETLDWPSPPYPAAVPELRARSRSSSNRRAPSTVNSIHGNHIEESDEDNDLVNDEEVQQVLTNTSYYSQENYRQSTGAHSVASSLARAKASRPNSKLRYHNNLFDNDYDDYMLRYKSDKDWKKILNKNTLSRTIGDNSVACESYGDLNNNTNELDEYDEDMAKETESVKQEESEEVKKIRTKSGLAAELLGEVEAQQKLMLARKLRVDPWKASRAPNAKETPSARTRYESPVNASPSRVYNYHNRSLMTSAMSGHTLSPTPITSQSQTTSATFIGDISLVNNTPVTPTHQYHCNDVTMVSSANPLTPKSINSLGRNSYMSSGAVSSLPKAGLNSNTNIVYNTAVPRPGYGLSSNRSITLPNSARYIGLSTNQNHNRMASPVSADKIHVYNVRQQNYAQYCRSTPNLIGVPKIYPYENLKRNREKKQGLPIDVDRQRLERHLSPEEFEQVFGMNMEQFYVLPEWQRVNLKKKVKLF